MKATRRAVLGRSWRIGCNGASAAQKFCGYPDRPIRLIVPFAAGGNADIVEHCGRTGQQGALTRPLSSKTVAVPAAGSGPSSSRHRPPDGYTLLVGSNGPLTVNPFVNANLKYDPLKDFAAIALTSYVPHGIIVGKKVEERPVRRRPRIRHPDRTTAPVLPGPAPFLTRSLVHVARDWWCPVDRATEMLGYQPRKPWRTAVLESLAELADRGWPWPRLAQEV